MLLAVCVRRQTLHRLHPLSSNLSSTIADLHKPSQSRIAGLDTLRAVAIVAVMLYHLNSRMPTAFAFAHDFGWMGVDLFFVLSGYLIGSQLLRPLSRGQRISPLNFYRKRAYRILPAYLAVLALYYVWPAWREDDGMSPLWQFLTFTTNLFIDYSKNFNFSHVWSLCIEEHFYLLLPLAVLLLARKSALWKTALAIALFVALGIVTRTYALTHILRPIAASGGDFSTAYIESVYYPTWARLDGLLAGLTLALIRIFRPTWSAVIARRAVLLLFTGFALTGLAIWMFYDRFGSVTGITAASTIIGFPILSLGFACLTAAAAERRSRIGNIRIPGATLISTLAYSLYLTHKEVGALDARYFPRVMEPHDWHTAIFLALTCFIVASMLYLCIERPFLNLRDRRSPEPHLPVDLEARAEPAL